MTDIDIVAYHFLDEIIANAIFHFSLKSSVLFLRP
jgi:hypothetical protein